MRLPTLSLIAIAVGGAIVSACTGGAASSATRSGMVLPAAAGGAAAAAVGHQPAPAGASSATRRTLSAPSCKTSAPGTFSFVGGGVDNVAAQYAASVVGGGFSNVCDEYATIAGGYANVISSGDGSSDGQAFIGGGNTNVITGNSFDSALAAGTNNVIEGSSFASFVGSGDGNVINGAEYSALTGGFDNTLSAEYGFIGAGINNKVSGVGGYVAAGGYNTVTGEGAVVDGGFNQTASGAFATIPGGYENTAAGTYSFAAGARASAPYNGDFVWSDGSDGDTTLAASRAYQFLARASGGVTFYTNAGSTVGASLAAGSGSWSSLSDRNAKTNVAPIDGDAVLAKVDALPISRWSYVSERGVRHVGPMAQDFYAAFKVGPDDRHITAIDEDGVALAAIKTLSARNRRLESEVSQLRAAVAELRAAVRSSSGT